jgi:hypothetical protein
MKSLLGLFPSATPSLTLLWFEGEDIRIELIVLLGEVIIAFLPVIFKVSRALGEGGLDLDALFEPHLDSQSLLVEFLIAVLGCPQGALVATVVLQHGRAVELLLDEGGDVLVVALGELGVDGVEVLEAGRQVSLLKLVSKVLRLLVDEFGKIAGSLLLHDNHK